MKQFKILFMTMVLSCTLIFPSFASTWQQDTKGWWYQQDDGSYPQSTWIWLDGNNDGISECYYFDANGYCLMNQTTLDGKIVNENGAWTVDGIVQTKTAPKESSKVQSGISSSPYDGYTIVVNTGTQKFHTPGCSSVSDIKDKNKGYCSDASYLTSHGYAPCKRCH